MSTPTNLSTSSSTSSASSLLQDERSPASVHRITEIQEDITEIAREILSIIIVQKGKTIKDINKIFQATLSNYFFECYVCGLIARHSPIGESRRSIKQRVDLRLNELLEISTATPKLETPLTTTTTTTPLEPQKNQQLSMSSRKRKNAQSKDGLNLDNLNVSVEKPQPAKSHLNMPPTPKYIHLIQAYSDEIRELNLNTYYINMLTTNIRSTADTDLIDKSSKKYATAYQKKLCALFVLEFFLRSQPNHLLQPYRNFSEIWNSVFTHFPINYFARERNIVSGKVHAIQAAAAAAAAAQVATSTMKSQNPFLPDSFASLHQSQSQDQALLQTQLPKQAVIKLISQQNPQVSYQNNNKQEGIPQEYRSQFLIFSNQSHLSRPDQQQSKFHCEKPSLSATYKQTSNRVQFQGSNLKIYGELPRKILCIQKPTTSTEEQMSLSSLPLNNQQKISVVASTTVQQPMESVLSSCSASSRGSEENSLSQLASVRCFSLQTASYRAFDAASLKLKSQQYPVQIIYQQSTPRIRCPILH